MKKARKARRVDALDGLRTLAIVAVLLYHLNIGVLPSGHMGVVVFLVLSGYFCTNAIMRVCSREGAHKVRGILAQWLHRLRRIWPSVLTLVACTGTLFAVLDQVLLTKMRPDVLPSLGFYLNWSYILNGVSYFQKIGGPSPLLHLWYLGVDMQFFLVWSIVLPIALKVGKRFARAFTIILALASAGWMAFLYLSGADPSRAYYGTDTRAFSLLLGALVALGLPLGNREAYARSPFGKDRTSGDHGTLQVRPSLLARLVGLASLAGIGASMVLLPAESPLWYEGGMLGISVLSALLIASLLVPKTLLGALLGFAPLRTLGQRAFALYLWHYPVFLLMGANKYTTKLWIRLAAVAVSVVAAELSLRLVERPFGPQRAQKGRYSKDHAEPYAHKATMVVTALAVYGLAVYAGYALLTSADVSLVPQEALVSTGQSADQAMDLSAKATNAKANATKAHASKKTVDNKANGNDDAESTSVEATTESDSESVDNEAKEEEPKTEDQQTVEVAVTDSTVISAPKSEVDAGLYDPVLIGDSVPGDAGDEFVPNGGGWQRRLPNSLIDTFIGRNPYQALEVLKGYINQKVVGHVVVMACFSNSTPYPETLDAMVEAVGPDRAIYLVGTVNPDGFQDAANANLQDAANRFDNVHYVDWPAVLDGHLEQYLWADATHLRPEGAQVYVDMIVRAIAQEIVAAGGGVSEF